MSDYTTWKELEIPIRVISYTPGKPDTYWDQGYAAEIEWEIDAPMEVRTWLMEQLTNDDLQSIEDELIDQAEENRRTAKSFARLVESELSQWDRERQRQADYAYDPLRREA